MIKRKGEIYSAVFFVVFSLVYFIIAFTITVHSRATNARLVPQLAGCLLFILSLINLRQSVVDRKLGGTAAVQEKALQKSNYRHVLLTLLFIALYIAGLSFLGFLISTVLFLCAQMLLLAPQDKRKPVHIIAVSLVCTGIIYYLFQYTFHVTLPSGLLG